MRHGNFVKFSSLYRIKSGRLQVRSFCQSVRRSQSSELVHHDSSRTRNIGIIAHIDAGKTTTTERMLYYSGYTRRLGDVDEGSTVTDFLPAERARGITIQSATITFYWPPQVSQDKPSSDEIIRSQIPHQINLIDTPGHADFTFEVRRSLRILDGAICVLDGVAGVEAQTEQVWNQAADWKIPRIVYVNKLDRDGAAFGRTVREMAVRLRGWPAICQIPWFEGGKGRFCGTADVVYLCGLLYEQGDGKTMRRLDLRQLEEKEPSLAAELRRARIALVELLSEHDESLVEAFLNSDEDHLALSPKQILASLRRCLLSDASNVIPVFAGASFRNIGVQSLLDAVNDLLPSPDERPDAEISVGEHSGHLSALLQGDLVSAAKSYPKTKMTTSNTGTSVAKMLKGCALAFKVVNDPRKGVLVYIRVYSGSVDRNAMFYNTNLRRSERASNLFRMYANEPVPVQSVEAGQIGVIAGSRFARTGDTLIVCDHNKPSPPEPLDKLQLRPIFVPPPVFFASLEPRSLKDEKDMHEKLSLLLREDPSLHVSQDEDTGQTLISGMGELHLEIAGDRLVNDLRANATMGKIAIGYRETLAQPIPAVSKLFEPSGRGDGKGKGKGGCTALVEPLTENTSEALHDEPDTSTVHSQDGNVIIVSIPDFDIHGRSLTDNGVSLPNHLTIAEIRTAYINGALAALAKGPSFSYPMHNLLVKLTLEASEHLFGNETSYSSLTAAARLACTTAFRDAAKSNATAFVEPVMNVDISIDNSSLGNVVHDISSSRGGQIVSLGDNEELDAQTLPLVTESEIDSSKVYTPKDPFESGIHDVGMDHHTNKPRSVKAKVPLKEMVGYLKHLRSMTGGRGTFTMSVDRFEKMTSQREKALIAELRGSIS